MSEREARYVTQQHSYFFIGPILLITFFFNVLRLIRRWFCAFTADARALHKGAVWWNLVRYRLFVLGRCGPLFDVNLAILGRSKWKEILERVDSRLDVQANEQHCKNLNARSECNDIIISVYSHHLSIRMQNHLILNVLPLVT